MSFLDSFFARKRPSSSSVARNRLQILLAHERGAEAEGDSTLLRTLHREILEVLARHVTVDQDNVNIKLDRGEHCSTLEIDIQVPESGLRAHVSTQASHEPDPS
ncbi:cell division topological specificity factor MinE [Saccharibacter sp. 17.LH.SD]|uniref:cell division topological specificity factor MinE n=1 Tax=Saccharibacter sp. 17.LH.SD TaxID=2689393 RepID=UPI001369562A|nr:cell division topological specificity factor MinE [Saccharibacter sp. 17.LH.SD]MXV44857.1 cell division topological specificity factor MinE [Saccharibacter sp. 17.LH.SD]